MEREITRKYSITEAEIKEAIYDWMVKRDFPKPLDTKPIKLDMVPNGPVFATIQWTEEAEL